MNARSTGNTQTDRRKPTCSMAGGIIGMAALAILVSGSAHADILYDTTYMTDQGTFTVGGPGPAAMQSFIGGSANLGTMHDMQVADDFSLSAGYSLSQVTADFLTMAGSSPIFPSGGVLVEIFQDIGGAPSSNPMAQVLAGAGDVTSSLFSNPHGSFNSQGIRLSVDLSSSNIELGAGDYWLSVVPIDETPDGLRYFNVSRAASLGFGIHARNGGDSHGTGYGGTFGSSDWYALAPILNRDISMKIEGTLIPAPGALALLALAGLCGTRRRRH